ncbi:unnamed protein product [Rotaria socialis]|uniref:Glycoside hydrolase 35 catalytic domain-containing protein n=1 Tax=Rotaria socialis TaxID=392032 RepID=A0A818GDP6_9BILA|nr:unnamed protein product [Rotaria socialis]
MKLWSRRINRMSYHRRFFVICGYLTILGISIYFLKAFVSPVVYLSTLVLDNERHLFIRPFNDKNRNREHLLPFRILSGSLHYFRVLPQSWSDRIKKMKAAGLNTIETYVPWNLHEPQRGNYQFGEGFTDLVSFLKIIHEHEMFTIIRPSGYICAEWDWGGLPSWLLRDETMRVRSIHPGFLEALQNYYSRLLPILAEYQYNRHGAGSIIAFQIENEYGSYGNDANYLEALHEMKFPLISICFSVERTSGFTSGAHHFPFRQYKPLVTSYDYDAPLNEAGDPTPKYYAIRRVLEKFYSKHPELYVLNNDRSHKYGHSLPTIPPSSTTTSYRTIQISGYKTFEQILADDLLTVTTKRTNGPKSMEQLSVNNKSSASQWFILYTVKDILSLTKGLACQVNVTAVADNAVVLANE